ncbi:REH1 [Candida jiufengensis]|uniref:REH1 n=1 Tax=Candida jiufengensis TaxID=497108 RepID=UPI0022249BF9|nr:REH1 [Candida jiufengensis]KAI5957093.1 REH1 [Candida jiufengensis]
MSFLPSGSNPETSLFTCNTCSLKFVNADLQRQHMKTEFHRYNLKRRIAQLPSISSDVFAEKILSSKLRSDNRNENEDEYGFYVATRKKKNNSNKQNLKNGYSIRNNSRGRSIERIITEAKDFAAIERSTSPAGSVASDFSQFSLNDSEGYHEIEPIHTGSELNYTESSDFTDYEDLQMPLEDEEEEDEVEDEEEEDEVDDENLEDEEERSKIIPITNCFFCGVENVDTERNIKHMFNSHGLYIPERSFLMDMEGLLIYLSTIISSFNCSVCGFQGRNLESIRQHVKSKGHCKIPYETKDEKLRLAKYYDFTVDDEDKTKRSKNSPTSKKVGFNDDPTESIVYIDSDASANDETYNDQEEEREESSTNGEEEINNNYSLVHIDPSGVELTTPIGSRIGHRSMQRYYRQNIALPVSNDDEGRKTQALVDRRFASGLSFREISKQQRETQKIENKIKSDQVRKMKPKKINFQRHFRDEILGT